MRLNNHGWGLKEMMILTAILVFFFGLALYFIYTLYNSLSNEFNSNSSNKEFYSSLEVGIEEATLLYLRSNYVNDNTKIDISLLTEDEYISEIVDSETGNVCDGYVLVYDFSEKLVDAYISCDNYETLGYEKGVD